MLQDKGLCFFVKAEVKHGDKGDEASDSEHYMNGEDVAENSVNYCRKG